MTPMTKRRLSQYIPLKREIAMLEDQIASAGGGDNLVTDYAKDYSTGRARVITLQGYGTQEVPRLSLRLERCQAECDAIVEFITNVDDSMMRQLLTRRYVEGRGVEEAGKLTGYSKRQTGRLINEFFERCPPMSSHAP